MNNPTPTEIRQARELAGLSQTQAAALVHAAMRTWQHWEAGDRVMHQAFWELFQIKLVAKYHMPDGQGHQGLTPGFLE